MATDDAEVRREALTWRVLGWFVILALTIIVWTEYSTLVVNSTSFNSLAPSISAVFVLAVFTGLVNPLLGRIRPALRLSPREQILLYVMLTVASPLSSIGLVHFLFGVVMAPFYHATPENGWAAFLEAYPSWFGVPGHRAALAFWEGSAEGVPWALWARPLTMWGLFVLALNLGMLSLVLLVQQQWIRHERLTFPLVYLPLELTAAEPGRAYARIWRDPTFWIGFAIAVVPHLFCGLHTYYPSVPEIAFKGRLDFTRNLPLPWRRMGSMPANFYPSIIGFAALVPLDVSLSVWFFFIVERLLNLLGVVTGLTAATSGGATSFPFSPEQSVGAWFALAVGALWIGRHHFRNALVGGSHESALDPADVRLHRLALLSFGVCLALLLTWSALAGLAPPVAFAFFLVYYALVLALARIRGEAGVGCISGPMMPQDLMMLATGTSACSLRDLTVLSTFRWFTIEFRGAPTLMAYHLEALKMGDSSRIPVDRVVKAVVLATTFTMVAATMVTLRVIYLHGGVTLNPWRFLSVPTEPYHTLVHWIHTPRDTDWLRLEAVAVGAVLMGTLTVLRMKVLWWPLHPVGYAVGFTKRTVPWIWFPFLLGWLLKSLTLRIGGHRLHQRLPALCLGLILGDFFMGGVFGVVGALVPQAGYQAFP